MFIFVFKYALFLNIIYIYKYKCELKRSWVNVLFAVVHRGYKEKMEIEKEKQKNSLPKACLATSLKLLPPVRREEEHMIYSENPLISPEIIRNKVPRR